MTDPSSSDTDFWEGRYRAGRIPWDFGGTPPALVEYLRANAAARPPGCALVPGCGSGYEVRTFHEFGWNVAAIDYSPAAVERARAVLGPLAHLVRRADFFADEFGGPFDLIYERTFPCSMPPERWSEYARRMEQLLKPGGLVAGLFLYGEESEPPPYPLAPHQQEKVLSRFELIEDRAIPAKQSLPLHAGMERWQVWRLTG